MIGRLDFNHFVKIDCGSSTSVAAGFLPFVVIVLALKREIMIFPKKCFCFFCFSVIGPIFHKRYFVILLLLVCDWSNLSITLFHFFAAFLLV